MTNNQNDSSTINPEPLPNFSLPAVLKPMNEQYFIDVVPDLNNQWGRNDVTIYKLDDEGERQDIYNYTRNYSMLKTFMPFRQYKNGVWHDYALISSNYMSLEVVDLEAGTVIAKEPVPIITQERWDAGIARGLNPKQMTPVGTELPGLSFCPMEFYVPDIIVEEELTDPKECSYYVANLGSEDSSEAHRSYAIQLRKYVLEAFTGQWGLYSGCLWGDDNYAKLRYVDLSRISEGIVLTDERFGYIALPDSGGGAIKDMVKLYEDTVPLRLDIATPINFDLSTGEGRGKNSFNDIINWRADGGW